MVLKVVDSELDGIQASHQISRRLRLPIDAEQSVLLAKLATGYGLTENQLAGVIGPHLCCLGPKGCANVYVGLERCTLSRVLQVCNYSIWTPAGSVARLQLTMIGLACCVTTALGTRRVQFASPQQDSSKKCRKAHPSTRFCRCSLLR